MLLTALNCSAIRSKSVARALPFLRFLVSSFMRTVDEAYAEFQAVYHPDALLDVTLASGETWPRKDVRDIVARIKRRTDRGERVEIVAVAPSEQIA